MSDKTQAQREAEKALDDALDLINNAWAEQAGDRAGVVVDYLLLYAVRAYDDEGDPLTRYGMQWPADKRTPHYAALGLVEYARENIKRSMFDCDCDE